MLFCTSLRLIRFYFLFFDLFLLLHIFFIILFYFWLVFSFLSPYLFRKYILWMVIAFLIFGRFVTKKSLSECGPYFFCSSSSLFPFFFLFPPFTYYLHYISHALGTAHVTTTWLRIWRQQSSHLTNRISQFEAAVIVLRRTKTKLSKLWITFSPS